MRVIAGTARRLPLKTLEGKDVRPTTDRIKETLFNILQPGIAGSYFLDLFAGSGQMGIEALSRGAACAVLVDSSRQAGALIQQNLQFTRLSGQADLLIMEVSSALRSLEGKYTFDYIFMDPPYKSGYEKGVLAYLSSSSMVKQGSLAIVEAALDTDFSYVRELGFLVAREKRYKTNKHIFLTKEV